MATEGGVRVLLADDDEDFLVSLRELIEAQRELSVVATATNGLSAIELVDELAPDAVVLDLHMPLLDGVTHDGPAAPRPSAPVPDRAHRGRRAGAALGGEGVRRGRRALKNAFVDGLLGRLTPRGA